MHGSRPPLSVVRLQSGAVSVTRYRVTLRRAPHRAPRGHGSPRWWIISRSHRKLSPVSEGRRLRHARKPKARGYPCGGCVRIQQACRCRRGADACAATRAPRRSVVPYHRSALRPRRKADPRWRPFELRSVVDAGRCAMRSETGWPSATYADRRETFIADYNRRIQWATKSGCRS